MERPRHERRHHFRGKARSGRTLPVRFRANGHAGWLLGETRDLGIGGAFIASRLVQPIGSELAIELSLPTTDQKIALTGVVRWTRASGMGVEFAAIADDVVVELNDYFAALTAG